MGRGSGRADENRGIDAKSKSSRLQRREEKGMRSIQYEKNEARTKGDTAARQRGTKDSSKVRGRMFVKKRDGCGEEGKWRTLSLFVR